MPIITGQVMMAETKLYVCDSNVIIRYLINEDNELARNASDIIDDIYHGLKKILIPEAVIAECVFVLLDVYKIPKIDIADNLIDLLNYKGVINEDKEHLIESLETFKNYNLHMVDCVILAKARLLHAEILPFDGKLARLASASSLT